MKESGEEDQDLQCWEITSTPTFNPEGVNLDASLSPVQREEVIKMLN